MPWSNIAIASSWVMVVADGLMQPEPPWPMDAMYVSASNSFGLVEIWALPWASNMPAPLAMPCMNVQCGVPPSAMP